MIDQNRQPGSIAEFEVVWGIILKGSLAIQTVVSIEEYVSTSGLLRNDRWVVPKPPIHISTN
jgi:hypothetical protein